jgi:hypothetical protein
MEVFTQSKRDKVPAAAVVATAMNKDRKRLIRIAPIDIMQLEAL